MKRRLLDLFCGAGGASVGYHRAGFEVVGVDSVPQPNYPFEFHLADALMFHVEHFDALHASPPCQSFTAYGRKGGWLSIHPDLVAATRELLVATGLPYVIENVVGAPLLDPVRLCGSSFGLDVRRHRLFESNFRIRPRPCFHAEHEWQPGRFPPATNRADLRRTVEIGAWRIPLDVQQQAMGIDWMTKRELSEAIPPAYTSYIGFYLLRALDAEC